MSQMVTRKSATTDEKEKSRTDSPIQDMKKKVAANAEKEKLAAEKQNGDKKDKEKVSEKPSSDKAADKKTAEKNNDKVAEKKNTDKNNDKVPEKKSAEKQNCDKAPEKKNTEKQIGDKAADEASRSSEKPVEKKAEETPKEGSPKGEKSGKPEPKDTPKKTDKKDTEKPKQNGNKPHNGVSDVTLSSNGGTEEVLNGSTVSEDSDEELMMVIDDHENDELFPELTYDDSDVEYFEPPTPESLNRSMTRRSQVKATRTPETPRPASDKNTQSDGSDKDDKQENSKETKILQLNEDPSSSARKLRSTDSPKKATEKPQDSSKVTDSGKKATEKQEDSPKVTDSGKKATEKPQDSPKVTDSPQKISEKTETPPNVDLIFEIEDCESTQEVEARKPDTNFSKSRVKVSPYRRSTRLADQTTSSVIANYTGNNTTMEMDITESSIVEDSSVAEGNMSYIDTIRNMRGRRSYRPMQELNLRNLSIERRKREAAAKPTGSEQPRPTRIVMGRKRKPEPEEADLAGKVIDETTQPVAPIGSHAKRMRLLEKFISPFRRVASSTPLPQRRAAPIVGINTDLPMAVLEPSPEPFDPESLRTLPVASTSPLVPTVPAPNVPVAQHRDSKCIVM